MAFSFRNILSGIQSGVRDATGALLGGNLGLGGHGGAFGGDIGGKLLGAGESVVDSIGGIGGNISDTAKIAGGQASSPEGRAALGTALGGPLLGAAGFLSKKEGQDKLAAAEVNIQDKLKATGRIAEEKIKASLGKAGINVDQMTQGPDQDLAAAIAAIQGARGGGAGTSIGGGLAATQLAEQEKLAFLLPSLPPEVQAQLIKSGLVDPSMLQRSAFAGQQQDLVSILQDRSQGLGGPSPAEIMLKQEQDKQINQQLALAASVGGRSLPAAQRQILQQQAVGGQEAIRQGALLRSQEQISAQDQLASLLGTARGQDLSLQGQQAQLAQFNAAKAQEAAAINAANQLQAGQFNVSSTLEAEKARLGGQQSQEAATQRRIETQAGLDKAALAAETTLTAEQMRAIALARSEDKKALAGLASGAASGLATLLS